MRTPATLNVIAITLLSFACASSNRDPGRTEGVIRTNDGIELYYQVLGSGSQTLVIPLATWWYPHVTALVGDHRVVLYDPRDRGRSAEVLDPQSLGLEQEISDLEAVREHFKLERMSLVGWSYLGGVAALYAARHPEHIDRLVMIGPIPPRKTPYWAEFVKDLASRKDAVAEAELARATAAGSSGPELCVLSWRARVIQALAERSSADRVVTRDICRWKNEWPVNMGFHYVLRTFGDWDWRGEATKVTAPTLLVHGERDNIPLDATREWATNLPNSRLVVIRRAGHFPQGENPQEFYVAVRQFLGGRWPDSSITVRRDQ